MNATPVHKQSHLYAETANDFCIISMELFTVKWKRKFMNVEMGGGKEMNIPANSFVSPNTFLK
jgi:hypothetical protein